jgi:hypothetical protein
MAEASAAMAKANAEIIRSCMAEARTPDAQRPRLLCGGSGPGALLDWRGLDGKRGPFDLGLMDKDKDGRLVLRFADRSRVLSDCTREANGNVVRCKAGPRADGESTPKKP